ncbi:endonuclease/exonuclease/phosphatase family protein [Salinisphaera japonica]|uniref:Endonuclease n=1 Tax=Salinisphaera japonica YTM-1 TaxID=1209778 RepID=A0A423Q2G9_9GAMM|nr:endonuclease/exonuclease/phosphatase family protein [Salinisphaera japonica]ROO32847.1 endonuclease [Salinisphaera japonica YTM-1]
MKIALFYLLLIAAVALWLGSLLPIIPTDLWWIRVADFPRLQTSIGLVAVLIGFFFFTRRYRTPATTAATITAGVLGYQAFLLLPYLPTGTDLANDSCPVDHRFKVMVANVRLTNDPDNRLIDQVRAADPDVFLALEVDQKWTRALAPLKTRMPHTVIHPTGSYFGIALYSRLPLDNPHIEHLANQDTPQIVTGVQLPTGEVFDFLGIHPRPPHPSQSALGRDAVLMRAAFLLRDNDRPGVVAGDFNAVPWEDAVAMMRDVAQLVDPRHGYGYLPTYDAQSWWMAWPLDHVFYEAGFAALELERGQAFGSDHYPYIATLCRVDRQRSERPDAAERDTLNSARDIISRARRQAETRASD